MTGQTLASAAPDRAQSNRWPIGAVLGGTYRVLRRIGEGGMGAVHEAEHVRTGARVAIKTLHREVAADSEAYRRFRREAEIALELCHPNIVEVLDFDHTADGQPYMVMELLEGEDLGAVLGRDGKLDLARTVTLLREVGAALQAAHERGIIHRDLKPQNIFLCRRTGRAKLLDFGISKIQGSESMATGDQSYVGSVPYMAPEQAEGRSTDADARTDIFALGCILYHALTGERPFIARNLPAVLYRIIHHDPQPAHELDPSIPRAVSEVIARAMAKNPAFRYPSVAALADSLQAAARRTDGAAAQRPVGRTTAAGEGAQRLLTTMFTLPV